MDIRDIGIILNNSYREAKNEFSTESILYTPKRKESTTKNLRSRGPPEFSLRPSLPSLGRSIWTPRIIAHTSAISSQRPIHALMNFCLNSYQMSRSRRSTRDDGGCIVTAYGTLLLRWRVLPMDSASYRRTTQKASSAHPDPLPQRAVPADAPEPFPGGATRRLGLLLQGPRTPLPSARLVPRVH